MLGVLALGAGPVLAQHQPGTTTYEIHVTPGPTGSVDVRVRFAPPLATAGMVLYFSHPQAEAGDGRMPVIVEARTADGNPLSVEATGGNRFRVSPGGSNGVTVDYRLPRPPSLWDPSTWPGAGLHSVHSGDLVYLSGKDAFVLADGLENRPAAVIFRLPDGWRAVRVDGDVVAPDQTVPVEDVQASAFLLGPFHVARYPVPGGELTLLLPPKPPYEPGQLAWSLQALLDQISRHGLGAQPPRLTFALARYPGALQLNPFIASKIAGKATIVHWIGTGSLTWWRKHAARDIVALLLHRQFRFAPDASWFSAGLQAYAGLLLLFETGFLTVDDMYQSLRAIYSTGLHYSGPAWPSLVLAGMEVPPGHASQRVLEFRAPLVMWLLDIAIRAASKGQASVLDLWARLAQTNAPASTLHTAAVLAPLAEWADLAGFAQDFIYSSRLPPADFDQLFQQWIDWNSR